MTVLHARRTGTPCALRAPRSTQALAPRRARMWPALALALAAGTVLPGCAPLILGGAVVGTALAVADRRTGGAQLEDQALELKALSRVRDTVGERGSVSVTSYNRMLLLTGEVPTAADRANLERAIGAMDNVRGVFNELNVAGAASFTSKANDGLITSRVKAKLLEANDIPPTGVKVVTDRGVVYLMGLLTDIEQQRAAERARTVNGVGKVVKVFETLTEAELERLQPKR